MMKSLQIRPAIDSDVHLLKNWFAHYSAKDYIANRIYCYLVHNHTVIALESENIIGSIQWLVKEDPRCGVAEIEEVFVHPDRRRRGIGKMLLESALNEIKKWFSSYRLLPRRVYLFVEEQNLPARNLYESAGFKRVTSVGDLFSDGKVELVYIHHL